MCHLRPGEDLRAELKDTLAPAELDALMASTHRPNYVVQVRILPPCWLVAGVSEQSGGRAGRRRCWAGPRPP